MGNPQHNPFYKIIPSDVAGFSLTGTKYCAVKKLDTSPGELVATGPLSPAADLMYVCMYQSIILSIYISLIVDDCQ